MQKFLTKYSVIWLVPIVLLAAVFRFTGINWDNYAHLHPDERYMTMVAVEIDWPEDFQTYLDPETSPLSPYNNNYGSYIYGTFPLFLVKYVAEYFEQGDYTNLNLVGRTVSGIVDLGNLVLIYIIGNNIYKKHRLGLLAALFYAVSVISIQQSHFFTTDVYETFFVLLSFVLLLVFMKTRSIVLSSVISVLIGISFGLSLASKISSLLFAGVILCAIGMKFLGKFKKKTILKNLFQSVDYLFVITVVSYFVLRLAQPYMFATDNWLEITPQADFINALNFQRLAIAGEVMFPPQWQWVDTTPYLFPISNLLIFGLGIPLGILAVIGLIYFVFEQLQFLRRHYKIEQLLMPLTSPLLLAFIWIIAEFVYRGGSFVKTIRYFFAIVPFLVIFAAYAVYQLKKVNKKLFVGVFSFVFLSSLLWAIAFTGIYTRTTTRIAASDWIYENVPPEAGIANEHWDDGIPFKSDAVAPHSYTNTYELAVYNEDGPAKIQELYDVLQNTDYIFVTSDRARKTIGELPEQYPIMSRYYQALDDGSLGYNKVAEFSSYPRLFGFEINDSSAEEAFWVYDHPTVRIYKKVTDLPKPAFECVLINCPSN